MRKHFSAYIETLAEKHEDIVFVTGDLGYNALENVRQKLGTRFINAGVAEQNMIGMAAGMASQGFQVICYSIAPFIVYRCLEQIRNDVCFHNLPVYIIGNGGGYGYGIMGSSHHAIEDIAALSGLPNITCYVPSFIDDLKCSIDDIFLKKKPAYLRLGLGKNLPQDWVIKNYGASKTQFRDAQLTIIVQGPVINNVLEALITNEYKDKIDLFVLNKMPLHNLPEDIRLNILKSKNILTVEEHIAAGGFGSSISLLINEGSIAIKKFRSLYAKGYQNNLYGSQSYHQQQSGLDAKNISNVICSYFEL